MENDRKIVLDAQIINFLKENQISIYCATLQDDTLYSSQDYTVPTALVVGNEATGLSQEWRSSSKKNIIIIPSANYYKDISTSDIITKIKKEY